MVEYLKENCFLKLPTYGAPFYIATDYSGIGIGAVLMQKNDEGRLMPIQFLSRSLTPTEQKYPAIEGEALAIIWSLERFRYMIEGCEIHLVTDHRPLEFIFAVLSAKPKLMRWALRLQSFNLKIHYVTGKANVLADAASRLPMSDFEEPSGEAAFELPDES